MPTQIIAVLAFFAPLFSRRVFAHVQVLVMGAILAPGKRTVTSALRAMGLHQDKQFQNYHRVLNRARWSNRQASRILLCLHSCPDQTIPYAAGRPCIVARHFDVTSSSSRCAGEMFDPEQKIMGTK